MRSRKTAFIMIAVICVALFAGEAQAFFSKKMSPKAIEEKAAEILKKPLPYDVEEIDFRVHDVEVKYGKDKVLEATCYVVPVSDRRMHGLFKDYFYLRLQDLYEQIPQLDICHIFASVPKSGAFQYYYGNPEETKWVPKLYFEFSRKTYEEIDWTQLKSLYLYNEFDCYDASL